MKTPVKRLTLFFFILLLYSTIATANVNWNNWGNQGIVYSSPYSRGTVFGSNYPQGNHNFTVNTITEGNDVTPLIQDFDFDGQNEIVTFHGSVASQYDNNGILEAQLSLNGTVCGNGNIINLYSNFYQQPIVMTVSGNYYHFYIFNVVDGFSVITDGLINKVTPDAFTSTCELMGGADFTDDQYVWVPNTDASMLRINVDVHTFKYIASGLSGVGTIDLPPLGQPFYHGGVCSQKYLGINYIYYTGTGGTWSQVIRFNTQTETSTQATLGFSNGNPDYFVTQCGTIGTNSSAPSVFVSHLVDSSNVWNGEVLSYDLVSKKTFSVSALDTGLYQKSVFAVADINKDGKNEYCAKTTTSTIGCYAYNQSQVSVSTYAKADIYGLWSIGIYDNSYDNMQLLTSTSIFTFSENGNKSLYNFSGSQGMILPVSILNKATYDKDVAFVEDADLKLFIGNGTLSVCPNGICEYGETVFSCMADCFNISGIGQGGNTSIGTIANGYQCLNDTWCLSGSCVSNLCVGLAPNTPCTQDGECSSNVCTPQGICGLEDNVDIIQSWINLLGFRSVKSKLFASLILILLTTAIMGGAFAYWTGSGTGALFGGLIGFVFSLITSIVVFGFIALWLFVGIIIIGVIGIFVWYFMTSGSGTGG